MQGFLGSSALLFVSLAAVAKGCATVSQWQLVLRVISEQNTKSAFYLAGAAW